MSISQELIKESLRDIKTQITKSRKKEVEKMLDYYTGTETDKYIKGFFSAQDIKETPIYSVNITKRFIDKSSRIYQIGAERSAGESYDTLTRYKDSKMKQVEKMANLLGSVAVRVQMKEGEGENDYLDYKTIPFYSPFFDSSDPFNPIALTYPVTLNVDDTSNADELAWAYWDDTLFQKYNENGELVYSIEHGLGVFPFFFAHKDEQIDKHFIEGATDIISCNEHTNIKMTELAIGARYQIWGQPWMSGVDPDSPIIRMGSSSVVPVPHDGRFGIESPGADITKAIELVKFGVELCAQNNHLWITWAEQGGEMPSGISLVIKDLERHEDYKDDIERWKMIEHKAFEVEKSIALAYSHDIEPNLGLDFNEPEYPKTVNDQILWDEHRLRHSLITEAELTLEYNEDLNDIKTANKVWQKRKTINDKNINKLQLRETKQPTPNIDNRIDQ